MLHAGSNAWPLSRRDFESCTETGPDVNPVIPRTVRRSLNSEKSRSGIHDGTTDRQYESVGHEDLQHPMSSILLAVRACVPCVSLLVYVLGRCSQPFRAETDSLLLPSHLARASRHSMRHLHLYSPVGTPARGDQLSVEPRI